MALQAITDDIDKIATDSESERGVLDGLTKQLSAAQGEIPQIFAGAAATAATQMLNEAVDTAGKTSKDLLDIISSLHAASRGYDAADQDGVDIVRATAASGGAAVGDGAGKIDTSWATA
ncbi:hypothetical protein [Nocardia sp. NPDC004722]